MRKQLGDVESVEKLTNEVLGIISGFEPERVKSVMKMMDGVVGTHFMTMPASARVEYHCCFSGGLAAHSLNVVENLRKIAAAVCPDRWKQETLDFVALFHDLGKAGDGVEPAYIPKDSDWHRKQGILFDSNRDCRFLPHAERGLMLLQKHGIVLSDEEYVAIRISDGMYLESNKPYAMKEPDLALLLGWSDVWSTKQEKL